MPQPFKGQFLQTFDALGYRPQLAAHVGRIAGMWAAVEATLSRILAGILGQEAITGMTLYMAIKAEPARLAAVEAVAAKNLPDDSLCRFLDLQAAIRKTGRRRDLLMHNVWALPEDDSDCIVLIDARKLVTHYAHSQAWIATPWAGTPQEPLASQTRKAFWDLLESPMRYIERDFEDIEADITELLHRLEDFWEEVGSLAANSPNSKSRKT